MREIRGGVCSNGESMWIATYNSEGLLEDGLMCSVEEAQVIVAKLAAGIREIQAAHQLVAKGSA